VGKADGADGRAPFYLTDFVTAKDRGGLTEACADGNFTLICGCQAIARGIIWRGYIPDQPVESRLVLCARNDVRILRFLTMVFVICDSVVV
jgi:hypothetical protein